MIALLYGDCIKVPTKTRLKKMLTKLTLVPLPRPRMPELSCRDFSSQFLSSSLRSRPAMDEALCRGP